MATYYVDPDAGGANNGTSWTDAWTDFQDALDAVGSQDVVYCRNTQTLTAGLATAASGGTGGGAIHFIGCDSDGNARNGWFVLDTNTAADYALSVGHNHLVFENFRFINANNYGCQAAASPISGVVFRQCRFEGNPDAGFQGAGTGTLADCMFIQCYFNANTGNTGYGAMVEGGNVCFRYCQFKGNDGHGLYVSSGGGNVEAVACLFHDNGGDGIYLDQTAAALHNCVIDGNTGDGVCISNDFGTLITGCRITHNGAYGISVATVGVCGANVEDWNGFYNNTSGARENISTGSHSTAMSGDGYTDRANDDFNLASGAEARDTAIQIDVVMAA